MMNLLRLRAKQLTWLPFSLLTRNLVTWRPMHDPLPGYTVVLGCMHALAPVAIANLRFCAQQDATRLHEMVLVFDCLVDDIPPEVVDVVREVSPKIRVRLAGYTKHQRSVTRLIKWGWVYSWLSWSLAIAQARTRAVILHDLDAMPVDAALFEQLYDHWLEAGAEFCGIKLYLENGVTKDMNLVRTYELVLDAAYVRERFQPFDLFNKLRLVDGRLVKFDTFLHAQWHSPRRAVRSIDEATLVHPSLLICHYTDLVSGRSTLNQVNHALLVLPYFLYLGGDMTPLTTAGPQIAQTAASKISVFERELGIEGVTPGQWAWMEKQIRRTEHSLFGKTRPEIQDYLKGFIKRAGGQRTVGVRVDASFVEDR
jgi:hypothetical protein